MDQIGPLTRTVADAALVLSLMAGPDERDPTTVAAPAADYVRAAADGAARPTLDGVRVGIPRDHYNHPIDRRVAATVAWPSTT